MRRIISFGISLVPFNLVRIFLYRSILGYRIDWSCHIGILTRIAVEKAEIKQNCVVATNNRFIGPFSLKIGESVKISSGNQFVCDTWVLDEKFNGSNYGRYCILGNNSLIAKSHFFDVVGGIEIQSGTWIAGCQSQFWTHGFGVDGCSIYIGGNCYLGSAVRFAPGSRVGSNNVVGIGSIVVGKFDNSYALIAGTPAKVVKENYKTKRYSYDQE